MLRAVLRATVGNKSQSGGLLRATFGVDKLLCRKSPPAALLAKLGKSPLRRLLRLERLVQQMRLTTVRHQGGALAFGGVADPGWLIRRGRRRC